MVKRSAWILLATLLLIPVLAAATPLPTAPVQTPQTVTTPDVPGVDAFLASLGGPAPRQAASSCGANFCTQQQRIDCGNTCHHHGIGLVCDSTTCTSECICGSILPGI